MKKCTSFEKKLTAYQHGELADRDSQTLEAHLDGCAACRAALEAQRSALALLGATLEAVPAPEWLVARPPAHQRKRRPLNAFERIWYSAQLRAMLATCAIFVFLVSLSGTLVVFTAVNKEEKCFSPPKPIERPKMTLKKPRVKVPKSAKPKPKSTTRIVTKVKRANMPDIQLPEMAAASDGLSGGVGGFDIMPELESVSLFGSAMEVADAPAEVLSRVSAVDDYSFMDQDGESPKIAMKKLRVPVNVKKSPAMAKPKLRKRVVAKGTSGITVPDIEMPAVAGIKGGLGYLDDSSAVARFGFSLPQDALFGDDGVAADSLSWAAPAPPPAKSDAIALTDDFRWMDEQAKEEKALAGTEVVSPSPMIEYNVNVESEPLPEPVLLRELEADKDVPAERGRKFESAVFNPYTLALENAFSTFSIDVDTASYGLARNRLLGGGLPDPEQVRTEEFINSFDYDYRPPAGRQTFAVHREMAPSPFRMGMDVLKIGIKGRRIGRDDHRGAVLTLVIDTSGSMATPERLGLVKESLALMIDQLNPGDKVAIVQFGGEARLVLEHTPASEKAALLEAINALQPGGPTQFDKGLELGYQLAITGFRAGDSNRIMILSDGVANLGELDPEAILDQVAEQRKKGIYLSVLGFGAGSYDDDLLERLANKGDGMYAYIDTLNEARHLLVDQLAATLHVIASDVKIQVEFNPARVLRYRQLGYENRQLTKEQFRDDTVDAGEVGSGQSVTALYDIELKPGGPPAEPIATVYVRYRRADNGAVEEINSRVSDNVRVQRFEDADPRFQLAVCTAEFAEHLRRSPYAEGTGMKDIAGRLQSVALELDLDEQVQELVRLISITDGLER
ncbi:YfbK domain-containing protein [Pontiella sulfatireligans]|uniref:VWFA domain-containing protein n=1 Tax=Pontiella sulfatireligans TaxID=2750658 RepID=A0A6C2UR40_9BACT|nr:von Willebrand factor type A domain-containing protein [Pontiella sulfatireligans]VGO22780.1 hypothetical protein SCARR_04877 [Pontiella sulfatireligans]